MKCFNFLMLLLLFFTSCKKEAEPAPTPQSTAPKNNISELLLKKAESYARQNDCYIWTVGDSLVFVGSDYGPVKDSVQGSKICDSISTAIFNNVYVEYVQKLPDNWYTSKINYINLWNGYYYTITRNYFDTYYTYYSSSGYSKGLPNGNNPFILSIDFRDMTTNKDRRIRRIYDPSDRQRFPLY